MDHTCSYILCVVDLLVVAGVLGLEGAGLTGADVAVIVAGVAGTGDDVTDATGVVTAAATGVF